MPVSARDQAIAIGNQMIVILQQMETLRVAATEQFNLYSTLTLGTVFAAMPTTAINGDGSLGTADPSPVESAGHVLDTRVLTSLSRSLAASDFSGAATALQSFANFLGGQAVSQQGQLPGILAKVTGGQ